MKAMKTLLVTAISFIAIGCSDYYTNPGKIVGVAASSQLDPQTGKYRPEWLLGGNPRAFWAEGKADDGIGETLTFTFDKKVKISRLRIRNGFDDAYYFPLNNRVKEIAVTADGGKEIIVALKDLRTVQDIDLEKPVIGKQVTLKILSVYKGTKWRDTVLSSIGFRLLEGEKKANFTVEPEFSRKIWEDDIKKFSDPAVGVYEAEVHSGVFAVLILNRNGVCSYLAFHEIFGSRGQEACRWKRSDTGIAIKSEGSDAEFTYTLQTDMLTHADSLPASEFQAIDVGMPGLHEKYTRKIAERPDTPWGFHPEDYVEKMKQDFKPKEYNKY